MSPAKHRIVTALRCGFVLIFSFLTNGQAIAEELPQDKITVLWTERRPFQYTDENGQTKGILVDLGSKIFAHAGLSYSFLEVPANRVLWELKNDETPLCAVGWYKTAEREAIAQFSLPVYQDKPLRGVFRAAAAVEQGTQAKVVFNDPNMRLLLKQGFAYGSFLDELIARLNPAQVQRVSGDARNLLRMLRADRADAVMLAQEEIDYYSKIDPDFKKDFKIIVFNEAPELDQRYIMCSKRVTPRTMKKLDAAIAATVKLK